MGLQPLARLGILATALVLRRGAQAVQTDLDSSFNHGMTTGIAYKVVKGAGVLTDKYLIATFPRISKVAYTHLPDNVWRPMITGKLEEPSAVAIDQAEWRMYVSDSGTGTIWKYDLTINKDGTLASSRERKAVVEGYIADWMSVDFSGDLYFTGRALGANSALNKVYRQDKSHINAGVPMDVAELQSGVPDNRHLSAATSGKAHAPISGTTGISTDNFNIYWGRKENGRGSIFKGSHKNAGTQKADMKIAQVLNNVNEIMGLAVTGNHIFWTSPFGVHGVAKGVAGEDIVAAAPKNLPWTPKNIVWDVDNTLYVSDTTSEGIFVISATNTRMHNLTRFNDAPGINNIAIFQSGSPRAWPALLPALAASAAALFALAG